MRRLQWSTRLFHLFFHCWCSVGLRKHVELLKEQYSESFFCRKTMLKKRKSTLNINRKLPKRNWGGLSTHNTKISSFKNKKKMIYTSYQPVLHCFLHQVAWELLLLGCMLQNPKWSSNLEPFTATTFVTHCAGWQNKWILIYQYFYRLCTDLHTPALAHILTCAHLYSPADELRSYLLPFTFTGNHLHTHSHLLTRADSLLSLGSFPQTCHHRLSCSYFCIWCSLVDTSTHTLCHALMLDLLPLKSVSSEYESGVLMSMPTYGSFGMSSQTTCVGSAIT